MLWLIPITFKSKEAKRKAERTDALMSSNKECKNKENNVNCALKEVDESGFRFYNFPKYLKQKLTLIVFEICA